MEIVNNSDHTVQVLRNGDVITIEPGKSSDDNETLEKVGEVIATPFVATGKGVVKGSKFVARQSARLAGKVAGRVHEARLVSKGKDVERIERMIKGQALIESERAAKAAAEKSESTTEN
jgi:hypothetical protein